jgi:hypothetical protein
VTCYPTELAKASRDTNTAGRDLLAFSHARAELKGRDQADARRMSSSRTPRRLQSANDSSLIIWGAIAYVENDSVSDTFSTPAMNGRERRKQPNLAAASAAMLHTACLISIFVVQTVRSVTNARRRINL